jgi:hypothetical protein
VSLWCAPLQSDLIWYKRKIFATYFFLVQADDSTSNKAAVICPKEQTLLLPSSVQISF